MYIDSATPVPVSAVHKSFKYNNLRKTNAGILAAVSQNDTVFERVSVSLGYATCFFAMKVRVAPGSGTSLISQPS